MVGWDGSEKVKEKTEKEKQIFSFRRQNYFLFSLKKKKKESHSFNENFDVSFDLIIKKNPYHKWDQSSPIHQARANDTLKFPIDEHRTLIVWQSCFFLNPLMSY